MTQPIRNHSVGGHKEQLLARTAAATHVSSGVSAGVVAERVGHSDGGALVLKRYRHLYPSESYAAAPLPDALVAGGTA